MLLVLLKTLVWLVLAWYVFRRLNLWAASKEAGRGGAGPGSAAGPRGSARSTAAKQKPSDAELGDYVDYEELDED
jgi:hypothetical protein